VDNSQEWFQQLTDNLNEVTIEFGMMINVIKVETQRKDVKKPALQQKITDNDTPFMICTIRNSFNGDQHYQYKGIRTLQTKHTLHLSQFRHHRGDVLSE